MAYEFTETSNLLIPDIESQLANFSESDFSKNHGLVVEIAAIHAGATANFNFYSETALAESINSWLAPYPKPIIMNHDPYTEAVGRVMGARMDKESDGTPYARLQVAILDPAAIQKVSDGRYLTGSVGGKAKEAVCSVCGTDWATPKESAGLPCRHQRGKVYSGKVAMMEMRNIEFKEYSFVNMPADSISSVRKIGEAASESDDWIKPARFFVLDMVSEGVVECTESTQRDVLEGMKKKDSAPLYMGLKGAFLSALAVHEAESEELSAQDVALQNNNDTNNSNDVDSIEENVMTDSAQTELEDDILAVTEGLSSDLEAAATVADEEASPEEESEIENEIEEEVATEEEVTDSEEEVQEEEVEEARPQGQEKPHGSDVDPETSDGAPESRETEEASDEEAEEVSEAATEEETEETELNEETLEVVEPHVEEVDPEIAALKEENAKLRLALHKTLVERVVDTKISVGMVEQGDRSKAIEEHITRSASSLADTLRDLSGMPALPRKTSTDGLEMSQELEVVGNEENVLTIGDEEDQSVAITPLRAVEEKFVDIFTGRLKLNS